MMIKIMRKTQLQALRAAATNLHLDNRITGSEELTVESILEDTDLLREFHHLLFEIHVLEGHLVCPESGRKFPIKDGIPNMLLHEDEV